MSEEQPTMDDLVRARDALTAQLKALQYPIARGDYNLPLIARLQRDLDDVNALLSQEPLRG